MPEIFVQWGETLKMVSYDVDDTVLFFRNQFYYSFEDHISYPDIFVPRGHFQWKGKAMKSDLLMGNYPFGDDNVIEYIDEPSDRVDVQMMVHGSPKLFVLYFDQLTTVRDFKRGLLEKAKLKDLPVEQLLLAFNGKELSDDSLTLVEYGVHSSALLRAKEIPVIIRPSLKHDLCWVRCNGENLHLIKQRVPIESIAFDVGVRESVDQVKAQSLLSVTCYEKSAVSMPLEMFQSRNYHSLTDYQAVYQLVADLKFNTSYCLELRSENERYAPGDNVVEIDFTTRSVFGKVHFSWPAVNLQWTESPAGDRIPIVHSLLHLLRKKLISAGKSLQDTEEKLLNVTGIRVDYETHYPGSNKQLQVQLPPVVFDIADENVLQIELELEHYSKGFDIFVEVLAVDTLPVILETDNLDDYTTPPVPNRFSTLPHAIIDEINQLVGSTALRVTVPYTILPPLNSVETDYYDRSTTSASANVENLPKVESQLSEIEAERCIGPASPSEPFDVPSVSTKQESVSQESTTTAAEAPEPNAQIVVRVDEDMDSLVKAEHHDKDEEMLIVATSTEEAPGDDTFTEDVYYYKMLQETKEKDSGDVVDNVLQDINDVLEACIAERMEASDSNEEADEVCSVHNENCDKELTPNRQHFDGNHSMLEFVEDDYLILMPMDHMDNSIMEAEDTHSADIIIDESS